MGMTSMQRRMCSLVLLFKKRSAYQITPRAVHEKITGSDALDIDQILSMYYVRDEKSALNDVKVLMEQYQDKSRYLENFEWNCLEKLPFSRLSISERIAIFACIYRQEGRAALFEWMI